MSMSSPPPPNSAGGGRQTAIGLVLIVGAGAVIYAATRGGPPPAAQPSATAAPTASASSAPTATAEPTGPTVGVDFQLANDEPDAGASAAPSATATGPRIRYVTRTISACPGSVDGPAVSRSVNANYGGLRECYNRALRADPNLRGAVTAEWVINPNGSVGQVAVSGGLSRNQAFKTCFQSTLTRIRFPAPRGGCALFQQSFNFTSGG